MKPSYFEPTINPEQKSYAGWLTQCASESFRFPSAPFLLQVGLRKTDWSKRALADLQATLMSGKSFILNTTMTYFFNPKDPWDNARMQIVSHKDIDGHKARDICYANKGTRLDALDADSLNLLQDLFYTRVEKRRLVLGLENLFGCTANDIELWSLGRSKDRSKDPLSELLRGSSQQRCIEKAVGLEYRHGVYKICLNYSPARAGVTWQLKPHEFFKK